MTTEAEKQLLRAMHGEGLFEDELLNRALAEARAAERARLRERVEVLPGTGRRGSGWGANADKIVWTNADYIDRAAVLAILEETAR